MLGPFGDLVYLTARSKGQAIGQESWDSSEIALDDLEPTLEFSRRTHLSILSQALRRGPEVGLEPLEAIASRALFPHGNPVQSLHSSITFICTHLLHLIHSVYTLRGDFSLQ